MSELDDRLKAFALRIKAKFDAVWLQLNAVIFDVAFPELYGTIGAGNDSPAIQAAINSGKKVKFRRADYLLGTALTIGDGNSTTVSSVHGVSIKGRGAGAAASEFAPRRNPTRLKWVGATGATVLTINGPISAVNLEAFAIDCAGVDGVTGVKANHVADSRWKDVLVERYSNAFGAILEPYKNIPGVFAQGANKNTFENFRCKDAGIKGSGIRIGSTSGYVNQMTDVAQNVFINPDFERDGNDASTCSMQLSFCDVVSFTCGGFRATSGSLGDTVRITPPTPALNDGSGSNSVKFPADITFYNCALSGGFTVDPSWAPSQGICCLPYHTGDGEPIPTNPFIWGSDPNGRRFGNWSLALPASVTPVNNGDLSFQLTSNTSLTFKVKGSDGTVRSASLTLS